MRWLDISETLTILRTLRKRTKSKNSKADTKSRNQILRKIEDEGKPNQTKQLPLPITFYIFTQKTFLAPPPPPLVCFQIKIRRAFSEIGRKDKIVKRYSWWLVVYTVRWCQCFTEIQSSIWLERLNAKQNKIKKHHFFFVGYLICLLLLRSSFKKYLCHFFHLPFCYLNLLK